jgi:hypothetical protein
MRASASAPLNSESKSGPRKTGRLRRADEDQGGSSVAARIGRFDSAGLMDSKKQRAGLLERKLPARAQADSPAIFEATAFKLHRTK